MTDETISYTPPRQELTAALVLANGQIFWGHGIGALGEAVGEVCFNTAMTGYQEILTDPSYAGQIITFTFPHIGNVGANPQDIEQQNVAARGLVLREEVTNPSNHRSTQHLDEWLKSNNLIGITGIDTRRLTKFIRENGAPNAVIVHAKPGELNVKAALEKARAWPGLEGMDLAKSVSCTQNYGWEEGLWSEDGTFKKPDQSAFHVVCVDYGIKRNILRNLAQVGARITVVPATTSADEILALKPDGIFLSNGPGDPAATGEYALEDIKTLINSGIPIFGICLGHQLLALALGATTYKMHQGHRGANHPVKDMETGKVEITVMNHGFAVDKETLPEGVKATHLSLFDGSLCGLRVEGKPIFSVQHHPEASPGPQDSFYLFQRFAEMVNANA